MQKDTLTLSPATEPGFYWLELSSGLTIVEVGRWPGDERLAISQVEGFCEMPVIEYSQYRWAGPIDPPGSE